MLSFFLLLLLAGKEERPPLVAISNILSLSHRRGAAGTIWAISFTVGRKTGRGGIIHLGRYLGDGRISFSGLSAATCDEDSSVCNLFEWNPMYRRRCNRIQSLRRVAQSPNAHHATALNSQSAAGSTGATVDIEKAFSFDNK